MSTRLPPCNTRDSLSMSLNRMGASARMALGMAGEAAAAAWLEARGYRVLDRNVRTRYGEIDLVAQCGEIVAFIEVKSRSGTDYGHPAEAVSRTKQQRLGRLAAAYLHRHRLEDCAARFDAIAIRVDGQGRVVTLEHIPDAFQVGARKAY